MTAESVLTEPKPEPFSPKESLATRFSDWLNPIVVKELRQAVQSRFVVTALLILLAVQLVAMGMYLLAASDSMLDSDAGRQVFMLLFGILLAVSMFFVPLYTGVRLAAERSETNLDLLFITTIKPCSIIAGKLLAAVTLSGLIFSACLPFLTFTYFLRGIDLPSMLAAMILGFVVVIESSQIAILVACLPVSRAFKVMIGLVVMVILATGYFTTLAGASDLLSRGVGGRLGTAHFWQLVGIFALNFACLLGLVFVVSVALITPLSANRALPVRAFLTVIWLGGGAAALAGSVVEHTYDPVIFWQVAFNSLFAISLFASVSERDLPGRRVLSEIPAPGLRRVLAFFFFSGAASGLAWTCLMVAASYGICCFWWRLFPAFANLNTFVEAARWVVVMNLYLLCYALTGALLRRHLFTRVGTELTWLIAALLAALGCLVPFAIGALFFLHGNNGAEQDYGKWLVGNPFVWDVKPYRKLYLSAGIVWATLVVAMNLHWLLARAKAFQTHLPMEKQQA